MENFFEFIAEEVREYLAALGLRSIEEAVGRVDLLDAVVATRPLQGQGPRPGARSWPSPRRARPPTATVPQAQDHGLDRALDHRFLDACRPAIEPTGRRSPLELPITNVDRTVGTLLGYEITSRHGAARASPTGPSRSPSGARPGQSFGAFVPRGRDAAAHR